MEISNNPRLETCKHVGIINAAIIVYRYIGKIDTCLDSCILSMDIGCQKKCCDDKANFYFHVCTVCPPFYKPPASFISVSFSTLPKNKQHKINMAAIVSNNQ